MSEKLYNIISKVMSVPVSEINDESGPDNIESWDSFNALVLIDELEDAYNTKFTLEEVIDVMKIADIKKVLSNHGAKFDD